MSNYRGAYSQKSSRSANQTLGHETHLTGAFSYTIEKISNLSTEVERLKALNENLLGKLAEMNNQKESAAVHNLELEREIVDARTENEQLMVEKTEAQKELLNLKKELDQVNTSSDARKKTLQAEINQLEEAKKDLLEEKTREKLSFAQQKIKLSKEIQATKNIMGENKSEMKKYESKITSLQNKDKASVQSMAAETERFKEFLKNIS